MTARATQVLPVIDNSRLRLELCGLLMAVSARDGSVSCAENEVGLLMTNQRKRRRLVPVKIVAALAGVEVRSGDKLPGVTVVVAIRAAFELDLEESFLALGNVALRAFHFGVSALQWIRAGIMFLHREGGWFPPIHGVTRSALPVIRSFGKLPAMRIGPMAIHAFLENKRLLKLSVGVAPGAIHGDMLSLQRELCL